MELPAPRQKLNSTTEPKFHDRIVFARQRERNHWSQGPPRQKKYWHKLAPSHKHAKIYVELLHFIAPTHQNNAPRQKKKLSWSSTTAVLLHDRKHDSTTETNVSTTESPLHDRILLHDRMLHDRILSWRILTRSSGCNISIKHGPAPRQNLHSTTESCLHDRVLKSSTTEC